MTLFKYFSLTVLCGATLTACSTTAPQQSLQQTPQPYVRSYELVVADKALHGFANVTTGFLEIPKNMINLTNEEDSNIMFGVFGGAIKGVVDSVGRMGAGAVDLITAPLPTKPIAQPQYIWQDFDADTTYGKAFRLPEKK